MDEIQYLYIGWCKETRNGICSDKVWTAFKASGTFYAGWGARGKKLQFKNHGVSQHTTLNRVINSKKKDYEEVDSFQLFTVFPFFKDDVEKHLMMSLLTGNMK